jgi:hypothetical protein
MTTRHFIRHYLEMATAMLLRTGEYSGATSHHAPTRHAVTASRA